MPFDSLELLQHLIEIIIANGILVLLIYFFQRYWNKRTQKERIKKALITFYNGIKEDKHDKIYYSLFFLKDDDEYDVQNIIQMEYHKPHQHGIELSNSLFYIYIHVFKIQIDQLKKDGFYIAKSYPKIEEYIPDYEISKIEEDMLDKNIDMKNNFLKYLKIRFEKNNIFIDKKSFLKSIFKKK